MNISSSNTDIKIKLINNDCESMALNKNWKRLSQSFKIPLTHSEPNINKLIELEAEAKVISTSYMITPNPTGTFNAEGTTLTGYKLAVDIDIIENIVYEECIDSCVFTLTKVLPISTFIVLDKNINLNQTPNVHICIEDIQIQSIGSKEIIESITMFIQLN